MTVDDLLQAHLINVQQEITKLNQSKESTQVEIDRLSEYLKEGIEIFEQYRSEKAEQAEDQQK